MKWQFYILWFASSPACSAKSHKRIYDYYFEVFAKSMFYPLSPPRQPWGFCLVLAAARSGANACLIGFCFGTVRHKI
jgi:hypothetical protein